MQYLKGVISQKEMLKLTISVLSEFCVVCVRILCVLALPYGSANHAANS